MSGGIWDPKGRDTEDQKDQLLSFKFFLFVSVVCFVEILYCPGYKHSLLYSFKNYYKVLMNKVEIHILQICVAEGNTLPPS